MAGAGYVVRSLPVTKRRVLLTDPIKPVPMKIISWFRMGNTYWGCDEHEHRRNDISIDQKEKFRQSPR